MEFTRAIPTGTLLIIAAGLLLTGVMVGIRRFIRGFDTKTPGGRLWGTALTGALLAAASGGLLLVASFVSVYWLSQVEPKIATAHLTFKVAGPHVEVTLNGEKIAVPASGQVDLQSVAGEYVIAAIKKGQPVVRSGETLHGGELKVVDESQADAIQISGPMVMACGPGSSAPNVADYIAIQGRWTIVSQEKDGELVTAYQRGKWIEFDRGFRWSDIPDTPRFRMWFTQSLVALYASENPSQIDILDIGAKGIYRLDRDTLTMAIADKGRPRPTEFVSRPGSSVTLTVCWRVKESASGTAAVAGTGKPVTPAAELSSLSEVLRFEGHQSWVGDFDISADGTSLVTGSGIPEAMVFVWSMENGRIIRRLKGHTASVHAVRFSPDGQRVISADKSGMIIQWDVAKEKEIRRFEGHNCRIQTLAWSPDGSRIASGSANWHSPSGVVEIRIWNAETGELVRAIPMPTDERGKGTVLSLRFLPDGKRLLANCEMPAHGVQILDIETGEIVQRLAGGHSKVQSATLSADGRFVATGRQATRVREGVWDDPDNAVVSLWELETDKPKSEGQPSRGSVAPRHSTELRSNSATTGRLLRELRGHRSGVGAVSFSPDGRLLASCSGGQFLNDPNEPTGGADHSIRLWDVASGRELLRQDHATSLSSLRFTPDGRHLVTNASGVGDRPDETRLRRVPDRIIDRIIDRPEALVASPIVLKEQRRLEGHTKNVTGLAFLSQGRAVSTSGDKTLRLWNVAAGELLRQWDDPQGGAPMSLAVSADERLAATGCFDGAITLWSLDAEQQFRRISAHTKPVHDLTFTPSRRQLLSVSADGTVGVWDVATGDEVRRIESLKGPRCVAVSPDGRWLVVGCYSWQIAIFNLETAALAKELKAVGGAVLDVTFSPDGRQVAAGTQDGHVVIFDVEKESIVTRLLGHTAAVGCLAWTPDGRCVVSGGDLGVGDQMIRIREVTTGREVARIAAETHILNRFALSPDGRQLLTGGGEVYRDQKWHDDGDDAIRLWQLPLFANHKTQ